MLVFALHRLLQGVVVVFAIFTITFFLLRFAPGSPYATERSMPPHIEAYRRASLGLDKPLVEQYWLRLKAMAQGDMDLSDKYQGRYVADIIRDSFPVSLQIGVMALGVALLIGIPIGAYAALRPNSLDDYVPMTLAMLGICLPTFVLGPLLALGLALKLGMFSVSGWYDTWDLVLPSLTLGIVNAAVVARLMRVGMLDTLNQDFIRTARAKGVSERAVVWKHALKHACLPVLNFLGPATAGLIAGSFVVESVFQVPGLGQHFVSAVVNRDVSLTVGVVAFYGVFVVVFNFLVDILQVWINPRLSFENRS
ncbi:ABC transporter permease [Phragmitibacter flavus]|uniref:ABC transporter permease n=1 Tax=Phragmitibacter flavus TaxID=2576071 RepID=A0A5R8KJF9_9BACT|nr:ABC transporter permease [Phragmitibacter flavus]TLD72390.1 ABC transporter permease [Phragmitibacter flavus]